MTASDWAAWVGAVTGVLSLAWEIVRWLTEGPKLRVRASATIRLVPDHDRRPILMVWVTNTGNVTATITSFTLQRFASRWQRFRFRPKESMVVVDLAVGETLPRELKPGQQWTAGVRQDPNIEIAVKSGEWLVGIYHAAAERPTLCRVPTTKPRT